MTGPLVLAAVGNGPKALWYMTRATGLVAMVLLSATVVLGIVCSVGWVSERWPRFVSQSVHRNLSLFALALVVVHVVTTIGDGYVPIGLSDAVIPFRTPYRTFWVGLGACAFDILVAVGITTALRRRIGLRLWRAVHWAAYACWPIALFHALGSGTDARLPVVQFLYLVCVVAVIGALGWRLATAGAASSGLRATAAVGATFTLLALALFAFLGPLRPGWSKRAGTSSALLTQLAPATTSGRGTSSGQRNVTAPASAPTTPFNSGLSGSYSVSSVSGGDDGLERVVLSMHLNDGVPLVVTLTGPPVDGGVAMQSSSVALGTQTGRVTSLAGTSMTASVSGPAGPVHLTLHLDILPGTNSVTGSVAGTAGSR